MLYLLNIIQISTEIGFDATVQRIHVPINLYFRHMFLSFVSIGRIVI